MNGERETDKTSRHRNDAAWLSLAQGVYTAATGIWPVLHMESFEKVTGPKEDDWLVKTVGLLFTVSGTVMIGSAVASAITRREIPAETVALGIGTAAAAAAIDVVYTARRQISPVYLLDAMLEIPIMVGWLKTMSNRNYS